MTQKVEDWIQDRIEALSLLKKDWEEAVELLRRASRVNSKTAADIKKFLERVC